MMLPWIYKSNVARYNEQTLATLFVKQFGGKLWFQSDRVIKLNAFLLYVEMRLFNQKLRTVFIVVSRSSKNYGEKNMYLL